MPVTSTRRISTSSTTGLPPFSGSSLSNTSSYRRSTALSPSRFLSTSNISSSNSTNGLGVGYYRSLSSSTSSNNNYRCSIAGYPSNESSYVSSRYSSKSTSGGDSGLGSSERARGSGLLGSRASIARSVALSGADLYAKYSPANYVPNSGGSGADLSRSRSLTDANRDGRLGSNRLSSVSGSGSSSYATTDRKLNNPSTTTSSRSSSSNRRSQVYGGSSQDEADDGDENNNSSRSGRSTLRRPKVALGGAGSAVDTFDGDIKVTGRRGARPVVATPSNGHNRKAPDNNNPQPAVLSLSACCEQKEGSGRASDNRHVCINNGIPNTNLQTQKHNLNKNVTKITINHSATCGSSIILNNSQCTSNNRAIVHIFGEQKEKDRNNNNNNGKIRNAEQRKNNNNSQNGVQVTTTTQLTGDYLRLNGDPRRQQEQTNGTRIIKVLGRASDEREEKAPIAPPQRTTSKMLIRQGISNGSATTASVDRSSYKAGVKLKRDPEIFLRDECDLVRNELMQKKIAEHNPEEEERLINGGGAKDIRAELNLNKYCTDRTTVISRSASTGIKTIKVGGSSPAEINHDNNISTTTTSKMENGGGVAYRNGGPAYGRSNGVSPMEMDTSEEPLRDSRKSLSSTHSSSSSSASSLTGGRSSSNNLEDIKFIDSDDNTESGAIGAALSGASSRMSKLNRTLASTLDSLKASTPIVGGRQYNLSHTNGHHTLPYHSSSSTNGYNGSSSNGGGLHGGVDYAKKYSTLSNLPSKSSVIRNGLSNGLFEEGRKTYSKDAILMGLVPKEDLEQDEGVKEHELLIKESPMDAMATTSEPPNDKISGKSWEVNGTNGSGIRTSSLRNALPPVSPVRTWERDRPRYRELLDAEPSTTSNSTSKYDSYDKGSSDTVEGLCGLRNIGNTCFMNSVIQCLSHTNDLTKFLRGQRDPKSTTKDQRIFAEYVKLIKDMWSSGTRSVTPMELKSAVSSKHRMYSGCGQQDAQEFLRFFLEALHGACNEGTKQEGLTLDDNLSDSKRADLMWDWYSKTESSVIKDLFVGQLRSTLKCTVCGNTSVTFDPFWDLSVPLPPSSSRCKLENCLELFIREEVLDGDEMPNCSKCKVRRKSTKSFTIQRFPKYLVIHLKRFSETRWSKLTNVVEFPMGERELNLAPYASNRTAGSSHYSLYGISNHMGSTAGGHYVALCKHPQTRKWHEFNDNHVSDSSESSLVSSSAYLLFYERA